MRLSGIRVVLLVLAFLAMLGVVIWRVFPRVETWEEVDKVRMQQFASQLADGIGRVESVQFQDGSGPWTGPSAVVLLTLRPVGDDDRFTDADFDRILERLARVGWPVQAGSCTAGQDPGSSDCSMADKGGLHLSGGHIKILLAQSEVVPILPVVTGAAGQHP